MTTLKVVGRGTKKCSSEALENRTIKNKPKLKRDTRTISASEVNRFTYCQYQWYYERFYGRTELGKLYKERNEHYSSKGSAESNYSSKGSAESNFSRGRAYHKNEYNRYRLKQIFVRILLLALIVFAVYLWARMG